MEREKALCLLSVFALLLTIFNSAKVFGQDPTILRVVPPPVAVRECQDFTVSVDIYNVVDMGSFQFKISWDPSFLEYVSHRILPGFRIPPIIIDNSIIDKANGCIIISVLFIQPLSFTGSGTLASITFHALKSGSTSITISEETIFPDPIILLTEDAVITILPSYTFVRTAGEISSYGSNPAHGWLSIFAVEEIWADGWCAFSVPPLVPIICIFPPPPFNFTLYTAWVVSASVVRLNYSASDFWISGFWAVNNVTNPRYIKDIVGLFKNRIMAPGEFSVKGNWTYFTLNIKDFEPIQGNITSYCVRKIYDIHTLLPYCDINHDYKIDIKDIAAVAIGYGSYLGFNRYKLFTDITFDLQTDIRDISKCALYYGKEY